MARTTLDLDESLIADAMEVSGLRVKKTVIEEALREMINARRRKEFAQAIMNGEFELDLTPEELAEMRMPRKLS